MKVLIIHDILESFLQSSSLKILILLDWPDKEMPRLLATDPYTYLNRFSSCFLRIMFPAHVHSTSPFSSSSMSILLSGYRLILKLPLLKHLLHSTAQSRLALADMVGLVPEMKYLLGIDAIIPDILYHENKVIVSCN